MKDEERYLKVLIEQTLQNQIKIIELLETMDWKLWEIMNNTKKDDANGSPSASVDRE